MTRVLFLTESFHPVLGGGERHIRALTRRLTDSGVACTVLTRRGEANWATEERLDGVRVLRVGPSGAGRAGKYRMLPSVSAALWRERARYDVIVVRGTRVLGLPGILAARAYRKAVVLQAEVNGEMSGEVYTWGTALTRVPLRQLVHVGVELRNTLFRDADAYVAMSRVIRDEFVAAGAPAQRVSLIPHGVDVARFRPASAEERARLRSRLGLPVEGRIALYTGRLLRGKGLDMLLEAFAVVARDVPAAHLVLIGSGADQALSIESALRQRAEREDLAAHVTFTGRVEDVTDYVRGADVFVFPSTFEGLGISLIEASACGLPCLGSRTGGIVDVIEDGHSGLLLPPGCASDWASALQSLLRDPDRCAMWGARARQVAVTRFDERQAALRYRTLLHEVAAREANR